MGEIRLSGLSTGIDTSTLISQLMAVEGRTLDKYEERQDTWNERKDALSSLKTKLTALKASVADLADARELRAYTTTSSDTDVLTAESSNNAFEGNHTIVVDQLANAERWVHTTGSKYAEDYVGEGTFIYTYNNQEIVIATTADTTLEEFVGLINNDANNPGVTANLLYYNDSYHIVFNGNDAGSDYQIGFNGSNTEVWKTTSPFTNGGENAALATKIMDLDQFTGTTFAGDESVTISGQQHDGTVVNHVFAINANTKLDHLVEEINDAFGDTATATLVHGQIVLTDHASGASQMQLNLTYNAGSGSTSFDISTVSQSTQGGSVTASLAGFTEADFTETQAAQDSRFKVDGFPTGADEWISRSSNTIDNVLQGVTLHLHDTGTVQVNLTRDIESVKEKLTAMVDAYNDAIHFVSENTGYNEDTGVAGTLMGDSTVTSINNELRMPLIRQTSGFVIDIDSFLMPGSIGLELDSDGLLNLDESAFDEAIAEDYMGVLALIGADKTGSSTSNAVQFYGASSTYTTAGTYDVQVTVSGGAITSAQMKLASESTYRAATFDGNIVTGDSTFTSKGGAAYAENGLQLSVDLSQDGTFTATVRVKQGFTGAMEDTIDRFVKASSGWLTLDQESVETQIKNLDDRIAVEEDRLSRKEERLVAKYARLEKTLTLLQNQTAALNM
jgi:flagellar capping protein FliD